MHTKWSIILFAVLIGAIAAPALGQETDRLISLDLRASQDGRLFYVVVGVGEGPTKQTFNLLVSTTFHMTWLPSLKMNPTNGYRGKTEGVDHERNFLVHSDTVELGAHVIKDQQLAIYDRFTYIRMSSEPNLHGMLGLSGYKTQPETGVDYLFKHLNSSSYIDKLKFSLYINKSAEAMTSRDDNQPVGALVLGGVDDKYYSGEFQYASMQESLDEPDWVYTLIQRTLIVSSVQLDWSRVDEESRATLRLPSSISTGRVDLGSPRAGLRLDSTCKLFVGPKMILDNIHLDFIGAKLIDDIELKITPEDYVLIGNIEGKRKCFSAFKPFSRYPVWVFGTRFLRNYYTVFDFENDTIGFSAPK